METAIIGCLAFAIYLTLIKVNGYEIESGFAFAMFTDILASFIPAPLPLYFNFNYSFSLARLRAKNIMGTMLEKTV